MDWTDTEQQASFREEVRELIARMPGRYRKMAEHEYTAYTQWARDRLEQDEEPRRAADEWFGAFAEKGWVAPHWPREYGGGGLSWMEQFILNAELAAANAPGVGSNVGINMLGPALIVHGTDEQKARHLTPILAGDVVWCQGFSEPGAGSDLASLRTRAVRDGDEYVVNGQKIWTTHAHYADWMVLLCRTDPEAPKHRGISFLLLDLHSPGVEIRPIIDMTGGHEINEDFFEDVRVPASNRVGEENRGWYVAMTLLDNERSNIAGAIAMRRAIEGLLGYLGTAEGRRRSQLGRLGALRQLVADRHIEANVMANFSLRIITMQQAGTIPNYEASASHIFGGESGQRLARTGAAVFGLYSALWDPEEPYAPLEAQFARSYVRWAALVGGGTPEIQRNIIATRGLGLPRG